LSCLADINSHSGEMHPIVLTTAGASLGHDLTPIAYVIQTVVPDSYSVFI
jgi:hypothetical protein